MTFVAIVYIGESQTRNAQSTAVTTAALSAPLSGSTATLMPSQRPEEPLQQLLLAGTCFTRGSSCSEGWQQAGQQLPDEPQRRALPTAGKRARRRRP